MTARFALSLLAAAAVATAPLAAQAKDQDRAPGQNGLAWNQYMGADRTGHSPDRGLLKKWPADGPTLAWRVDGLGASFSSVTFAGDKIFTMGDDEDSSRLLALNVANGKVLWSAKVGSPGGTRNPGPRSTPSTDGKLVFGLGHDGWLICAYVKTGKIKWKKNLPRDLDGRMMSGWGYSESPLLDGDLLVCTPGGNKGAVVALKKKTGKVAWRCKGITDRAAYCSLVPAEIGGIRQYILLTGRNVAGIHAKNGKVLWRASRPGRTAVCSTPVYKDGYLFVSSAYRVGCNGFKVSVKGGKFSAEEIYQNKELQSHHGGFVLVGDYVYGIGRRNLKCIELKTGKVMWENRCVGKGSITYADGHLICRSERRHGRIALVEATPEGYKEKGRFDQPDRSDTYSWAHSVVYGGKLYIRDQGLLLCYDLKGE